MTVDNIRQTHPRVELQVGEISLGRLLIIMVNSVDDRTPDDHQLFNAVAVRVLK